MKPLRFCEGETVVDFKSCFTVQFLEIKFGFLEGKMNFLYGPQSHD